MFDQDLLVLQSLKILYENAYGSQYNLKNVSIKILVFHLDTTRFHIDILYSFKEVLHNEQSNIMENVYKY